MTRKPENRGACAYCGEILTRRSVDKHLEKCTPRQAALAEANASSRPADTIWRLRVQDAYDKDFWLDLEMNGAASMNKLDDYLRAIWLECCDHLSQFTIGGWGGATVGMARKANAAFVPGLTLRHQYDFGTTSETDVKVLGSRQGKPVSGKPIALLARNLFPMYVCHLCGQPAQWLCQDCLYEIDEPGYLCAQHGEDHPHDPYGESLFPLVNSPRLGLCGYDGPAEPPY